MTWRTNCTNPSVAHGIWGESLAAHYLRRKGYEIVDRNARPVTKDRRLEIDLVAWERETETLVFVEVKQHESHTPWQCRLRSVNHRKRLLLRRACNAWRRTNKWQGSFRFDVIEVYGVPGKDDVIIDHISNVNLFARRDRFVKWS